MNPSYLKIGGELLSDALLDTVVVTQELNRHWRLEVRFRQTRDEPPPFESYLGRPCELFTYDEDGAQIVTFQGYVLRSKLDQEIYGSFGGRLVAVSQSNKMELAARHACYTTGSLAAIAGQVTGWTGLSASVRASAATPPRQYVQWGETDFAFLRRVCDDHGAWLRPSSGGVEICDRFQASVPLEFREEYGLLSFEVAGKLGPAAFDGAHYDAQPMASQSYRQIAQAPGFTGASGPLTGALLPAAQQLPSSYLPERSRAPALADFESRLRLESGRALGSQVTAHGISRELRVQAGGRVEIGGAIDAAGTYGVTKVIHRWTLHGYENEFWCTPWVNWIDPQPPAARKWYGVVPARLIEHSDAGHMGRHRIRFIWQEAGEPMLWARMAMPHAGQGRGIFFQPEIGDEVVVAFEDGDPERPLILGCAWNGVDTSPTSDFWGGEYPDNDAKRIVTKSGNRIQMVDQPGKPSLSLATPDNLKVSMFENANETGRSMLQMSNATGDIFLSAPNGRIHFVSQQFSREVGSEGAGLISRNGAGHPAPAPAPATGSGNGFLSGVAAFGSGLYEGAVKPLVDLVEHPIQAAEGIGHAIAHPVTTAEALGHAIYTGSAQALSGDPHAIGLAMGTVGSMLVPGAGEAEAVGDAAKVSEVAKVADAAEVADAAKAAEVGEARAAVYKAKLRGQEIELAGVEARPINYTKRARDEYLAMRNAFNQNVRGDFLKQISSEPGYVSELKDAGFSDGDLSLMQGGQVPKGWSVHHKLPLDDNGTNDLSNLILMQEDPYHQAITNAQSTLTRGMSVGETRSLDFPVPAGDIIAYPTAPVAAR